MSKKKSDISESLLDIADKLEHKRYKRRLAYENDELKKGTGCLSIPVIGGFIYVFKRIMQARYINKELDREMKEKSSVRDVIRERNKIKRSIHKQLDSIVLNHHVVPIQVPRESLHEFMIVKNDFPMLVFDQLSECEFMVYVKEDVV